MASPSRYLLSKLDWSSTQAIYVQVSLVHRYSPKEDMGIERPPKGSGRWDLQYMSFLTKKVNNIKLRRNVWLSP